MISRANHIQILHDDGTIGVYAHLAYGGVSVRPGLYVKAGEEIGKAGSTGFSSGPHLHFVVLKPDKSGNNLANVSQPFKFYVGKPPVTFSPTYGTLVRAEYNSPYLVLDESRGLSINPYPIKRFLAHIPTWLWMVGMTLVVVFFLIFDKIRTACSRKQLDFEVEPMEPTISEEGITPEKTDTNHVSQLILACNFDRDLVFQLIKNEKLESPDISDQVAACRALEKIQNGNVVVRISETEPDQPKVGNLNRNLNSNSHDDLEYAGFWVRLAACVIDTMLIFSITWPALILIYGWKYFDGNHKLIAGPADFLISWVLPAMAVILFWIHKDATPGKMAFSLSDLDAETGTSLSIGQSIGRYLAYFAASLPLGLGFFWVAFDSKKQGWHDKLAGTVVVRLKNIGPEPVVFSNGFPK